MALVSGVHCVHSESGARLWERSGSGERGDPERPREGAGPELGDMRGPDATLTRFSRKVARAGQPQGPL